MRRFLDWKVFIITSQMQISWANEILKNSVRLVSPFYTWKRLIQSRTHVPWPEIQPYSRVFQGAALLTFWAEKLCWGDCPMRCRMFSSIPDLQPLDASNTFLPCKQPKMSPNISKCSLHIVVEVENNCRRTYWWRQWTGPNNPRLWSQVRFSLGEKDRLE